MATVLQGMGCFFVSYIRPAELRKEILVRPDPASPVASRRPTGYTSTESTKTGIRGRQDETAAFSYCPAARGACRAMSASGPERRTTRNRRQADVTLGLHREILAHIADGVSVVSPVDLVILYASPRFEAMFGYGPGELTGRPVELLNADNGQPAALVAQAIVRALESRGSWAGELRNRRRDGSVFWTRASVLKRELPGWGHIYLSTQSDISELKQAEADMVESEQSFRSLVSTSMDAVLLTAPAGRILLANEAACRMFGRSETELIRLGRGGVVDPGDPAWGRPWSNGGTAAASRGCSPCCGPTAAASRGRSPR